MKKLLTTAALVASVAAMSLPATAATTTASGTVIVDWNVSTLLTMALAGNYTNTGASGAANLTPSALNAAGGAGNCTGGGTNGTVANGNAATPSITLDFGAIQPDLTHVVGCWATNAAEAQISTNDSSGVILQEDVTTAATHGAVICASLVKGNKPVAMQSAGVSTGVSASAWTAAGAMDTAETGTWSLSANTQLCGNVANSANAAVDSTKLNVNATAITPATTSSADTVMATNDDALSTIYVGEDYAVLLPANATKGADTATVTYTVTAQ